MSDPLRAHILILDPDQDFLQTMEAQALQRELRVTTQVYSARDRRPIEDIILETYPDILIINLDQDPETEHGAPVLEVKRIPLPLAPLIMGTTNRDAISLKAQAYSYGLDDYMLRPFSPQEMWLRLDVLLRIRRLQRQLDIAAKKLSGLNKELALSNQSLEEMTITDELTGLNNMRFMTQYLEKQFQLFSRYDRPFSILMIDLDNFKKVNDSNDHLVGSDTIQKMGEVIQAATRSSDIKARYGGDEYIIAMPETKAQGAFVVGERIRSSIEELDLLGVDDKNFTITASVGVATFDGSRHSNFREIIRDADYSLYLAKKKGRNQVVVFDSDKKEKKLPDEEGYDESQSSVLTELSKIKKTG